MSDKESMYTKEGLRMKIDALSFAALEANLYLDGHPDDKEALQYYREKTAELIRLRDAYEEEFAPLFAEGSCYDDDWQWVKTPFPWEMEA